MDRAGRSEDVDVDTQGDAVLLSAGETEGGRGVHGRKADSR